MNNYKVITLNSKESTDLIFRNADNVFHYYYYYGSPMEDMGDRFQHIYFVEEKPFLELGDYFINTKVKDSYEEQFGRIGRIRSENEAKNIMNLDGIKKIVASTNQNLDLPVIKEDFVKHFAYYNGEIDLVYCDILGGVVKVEYAFKHIPLDNKKIEQVF